MVPVIPSAKLTVSYPLFAADFNPRNSDYLVVGGGGGEGRSGVGNRIVSLYGQSIKNAIADRRWLPGVYRRC